MRIHIAWLAVTLGLQSGIAQKGAPAPFANRPDALSALTRYDSTTTIIYGKVALEDGSAPRTLVMIERICAGKSQAGGFADSKGRFSFDIGALNRAFGDGSISTGLDVNSLAARKPVDPNSCEVHANAQGFRSENIALAGKHLLEKPEIGTLVLRARGKVPSAVSSAGSAEAPKNSQKLYYRGVDDAAKAKWREAAESFQKAVAAYPQFSEAWLAMGIVAEAQNDLPSAMKAYQQAVAADERFAVPYIQIAGIGARSRDWQQTGASSGTAIRLDPDAFPQAYLFAALASLNAKKPVDAETIALAGIARDPEHTFPELEHILGMALAARKDFPAAALRFAQYLKLAPNADNADAVRKQLAAVQSINSAPRP